MMTKTYTPTRREKLKIWFEKDAFQHNVFTPFELCTEIVSQVDVSDRNILVMNPEFALVLIEEFGVDPSRITIFADVDPIIETIARRMGINYIDAWNYNMKFDVVFGNPPYSRELWKKFFEMSIEQSDVVAIISPNQIGNPISTVKREKFKQFLIKNGVQEIQDCTDSFPNINTGRIGYFILDKSKAANLSVFEMQDVSSLICNKITSCATQKLSVRRGTEYINHSSGDVDTAVLKTLKDGNAVVVSAKTDGTTLDASRYWFVNRFFGSAENSPVVEVNGSVAVTPNLFYIDKIDGLTADDFQGIYTHKLFRFFYNTVKDGGMDTPIRALKALPIITDTDVDMYEFFSLTQEEIEYVEANV